MLDVLIHKVTCTRLGEVEEPAGAPLCGCQRLSLTLLLPAAVLAPWAPGVSMGPIERATEIAVAAGKLPKGAACSPLEFLLAVSAHVPVELRSSVISRLMSGGAGVRLDTSGRTMLSALMLDPRR